jgi:hypothetical protein
MYLDWREPPKKQAAQLVELRGNDGQACLLNGVK